MGVWTQSNDSTHSLTVGTSTAGRPITVSVVVLGWVPMVMSMGMTPLMMVLMKNPVLDSFHHSGRWNWTEEVRCVD